MTCRKIDFAIGERYVDPSPGDHLPAAARKAVRLEIPWRELKITLSDGLVRLGLAKELSDTFPIDTLLANSLVSRSEYWTRLALERIEERGMITGVRNALAEAERVAPTQQLRHRAKRLLGRLRE